MVRSDDSLSLDTLPDGARMVRVTVLPSDDDPCTASWAVVSPTDDVASLVWDSLDAYGYGGRDYTVENV